MPKKKSFSSSLELRVSKRSLLHSKLLEIFSIFSRKSKTAESCQAKDCVEFAHKNAENSTILRKCNNFEENEAIVSKDEVFGLVPESY